MHLLDSELKNKEQWEKAEISLPQFDRQAMKEETKKNPQWVHFGAGNIFRAFPAALQQKLLNEGIEKTGIIVAEGYDYEIINELSEVSRLSPKSQEKIFAVLEALISTSDSD